MEHRGYLHVIGEGGYERDVLSCSHCQRQIVIAPANGCESVRIPRCQACFKAICPACEAELFRTLRCVTFEQRLEAQERKANL